MKPSGPAFPRETNNPDSPPGLSKLDYFAAAALPELIRREMGNIDEGKCRQVARVAFNVAAMMVDESESREPPQKPKRTATKTSTAKTQGQES